MIPLFLSSIPVDSDHTVTDPTTETRLIKLGLNAMDALSQKRPISLHFWAFVYNLRNREKRPPYLEGVLQVERYFGFVQARGNVSIPQ